MEEAGAVGTKIAVEVGDAEGTAKCFDAGNAEAGAIPVAEAGEAIGARAPAGHHLQAPGQSSGRAPAGHQRNVCAIGDARKEAILAVEIGDAGAPRSRRSAALRHGHGWGVKRA